MRFGRRPGRGVVLFLAVIWLLAASSGAGPVLVRAADEVGFEDYKLATSLYRKGRWKLAAESYEKFLKQNQQHRKAETARYYLGLTYINLDSHAKSRDVLRTFVKDFPKSEDRIHAAYWIGQSSYILEDFASAERELKEFVTQAAATDALLERAWPYLAESELRLNKAESALQHFQKALKAFPQSVLTEESKFGAARAYQKLNKRAEAIAYYKELSANRAGARAADSLSNMATISFEAGDFPGAAQAYAALEKNFPESPVVPLARLNHGFALFRQGAYPQAADQFDRAATSAPHAAEATLWKGLSLKAQGALPHAVALLSAAAEKYKDQPLAESLLFQWADCEYRRNEFDKARELFLQVADRFPKGTQADEAVQAASLAALQASNLPETEKLLARFDRDYPNNRLRLRQELLRGRYYLAKGDIAGAAQRFQAVLQQSTIERTKHEARYYSAIVAQRQEQHPQVLAVSEPLVAALPRDRDLLELSGVFVVRGVSALALGKKTSPKTAARERLNYFQNAVQSAQKYLELQPRGPLGDQALAVVALGSGHSGQKPIAVAALQKLKSDFPRSVELDRVVLELAELSLGNEDGELSTTLFGELAARPVDSKYRTRGLSGLGWTQYKLKKFADASATFAKLSTEHPQDPLAAEAAFMQAKSLQLDGKVAASQAAYAAAFEKFGTTESAFLAGLQAARLLGQLNKADLSDAAYARLFERFPKPNNGDRILDEWGAMNYNAGRFAAADEIFRRIARDYPASPVADNALLSLAESDLVSGKVDAARTQFTTLAASPKSDADVQQRALLQLMVIERQAKRWDELRKVCRESLTKFPQSAQRWQAEFHWAEADFQSQLMKETRDRLLKLVAQKDVPALNQQEWFPRVWVILAESQYRLKEYATVIATAEACRKWNPKSSLLYQVDEIVGRSYKSQAKFAEAREAFLRVIRSPQGEATETAAKSQFQIAETYLMQKDHKQAALEYLRIDNDEYKGFPAWQAPALFQAGQCHEALSDWKEARADYENLMSRFPQSEFTAKAKDRLTVVRDKLSG